MAALEQQGDGSSGRAAANIACALATLEVRLAAWRIASAPGLIAYCRSLPVLANMVHCPSTSPFPTHSLHVPFLFSQACDLPMWERLVAVATQQGTMLADVEYMQFAQAHLLMQLRYGDAVPCPPQLLQRSQAAWQADL